MGEAGRYPVYPMIDPVSRPAYLLLGLCVTISVACYLLFGFSMSVETLTLYWMWPTILVGGLLARRIGLFRLATVLQSIAVVYGQGLCLLLFVYGMAAVGAPYADGLLAAADRAMGFDWPAYAQWSMSYFQPLNFAYRSFTWQPLLLIVALTFAHRQDRLWTMIAAVMVSLLLTTVIFGFFPAHGVFHQHGISFGSQVKVGTYEFDRVMDYLRGGGRVIDRTRLTGLISFPSFHTTVALLNIWAAWPVKWLRWPMLVLNALVLLSVPMIGAHYLIDAVGGALVALVAVPVALGLSRRLTTRDHTLS